MEVRERQQVVQCVVMQQGNEGQVLMGKRKRDNYWEFLGGKLEKGEDVIDAGIRELSEETGVEVGIEDVVEHRNGESYRSKDDGKYVLNPLKLVFKKETFSDMDVSQMPDHSDYRWIDVKEFYSYETLGQYQALENLGIVNGDVAIAVPFNGEKYLLMKRAPSNTSSGFWAFPGGKIEDYEEGKGAVLRELEEETQLNGTIERSGDPYIDEGQLGFWRIFPYLVHVNPEAEAVPDADHSAHEWVDLEDLEEKETLGETKSIENLDLN